MKRFAIAGAALATSTMVFAFPPRNAVADAARTLVFADAGEPSTIDPAKANINWEFTVTRNVYDRLVNFDLGHQSTLLPGLATNWHQDGNVWTFSLRKGVTFQDGSPFTSADVKATIDRLLRRGQGQSYLVSDIANVSNVDDYTVKIETKAPTVYLAANLSRIEMMADKDISKHAKDPDQGDAWFSEHANGTGPYSLVSWTRGSQIELARNTKWWGKFAARPFDRIIDRFVTDGANRSRGLEGGEFDLAAFVPRDDALRIGGTKGFHAVEGNNLWAWPVVYLNMNLAPTNNKDFRAALVKAFDYSAMVQFYQGKADVPRGPIPSWFPGSPEMDQPVIKTDLDGAKAAIAASGLAGASFKCSVPSGFSEFRFAATVLQSSAAQVGVKVEIEELPFVEAITAIKSDKSNCFVLGNANLSPTDATKFFAAHYMKGGFFNSGNYFDRSFEDVVAKLPTVNDDAERYKLVRQAADMIVDAHYVIWTARPTTVVPVPDRLNGFNIDPADYINVRFWEIESAR